MGLQRRRRPRRLTERTTAGNGSEEYGGWLAGTNIRRIHTASSHRALNIYPLSHDAGGGQLHQV